MRRHTAMSDQNRLLSREMLSFHRLYNEKISRRIRAIHVEALSQAEFLLLAIVLEHNGVQLSELITRSNMKKQQVNRMVNQLEEKGMVVRQRSAVNRRTVQLMPTEAAAALQKQAIAEIENELAGLFGQLDEQMAQEYLCAIQTINGILAKFPAGNG